MSAEAAESLLEWAESLRAQGKRLVTTNGVFDLLHAGHVETLTQARAHGDALLVLINSDASVRRYKGPSRPFVDAEQRKRMLEALRCVDRVVIFDEDTPLVWLARLRPVIHVKGGSWLPERIAAESTLLETWGGKLVLLPLEPGLSTTLLADRICRTHLVADDGPPLPQGPSETCPGSAGPVGSRYPYLDLRAVQTISIAERANLVTLEDFARPAAAGNALGGFLEGLPLTRHRTNTAGSLTEVVQTLWRARALKRSITWGLGPHVVKYGLSLLVADLMERGLITAIATNGAGAIHDCELALFGVTSEEMTGEIQSGRFGMARETGEFLNEGAGLAVRQGIGYGEALGQMLHAQGAPHRDHSILARAYTLGIPVTVHVAIGTDIVHAQPSFRGEATGGASHHDFQILASCIDRLDGGGVHLNVASSVVLPEIFLKALTVANNLRASAGRGPVRDFLTVVLDHQSEYRPLMNVVRRPTVDVGRGLELLGRVELMFPLLHALLVAQPGPGAG